MRWSSMSRSPDRSERAAGVPDPRVHVTHAHLHALQGAARGLSFLPLQAASSALNGRHGSRLRGRGLHFEEMRGYLPGDDIRAIDWKATARTGRPFVRVYTEERDRPALLVVDQRMSMFFGSRLNMKSVTAAEAAAIAAFRILEAGDRVGGVVFNDRQVLEFVPKRSRRATSALLEAIATCNGELHADKRVEPMPGGLNAVLGSVSRLALHDHLVIVFSDFDGIDGTTERRLAGLAAHNDLILVLVSDPIAERIGRGERAVISDGQRQAEVDLGSTAVLAAVGGYSQARLARIRAWQSGIRLSVLPLSAAEETLPQLRGLMGRLAQRRRVR